MTPEDFCLRFAGMDATQRRQVVRSWFSPSTDSGFVHEIVKDLEAAWPDAGYGKRLMLVQFARETSNGGVAGKVGHWAANRQRSVESGGFITAMMATRELHGAARGALLRELGWHPDNFSNSRGR